MAATPGAPPPSIPPLPPFCRRAWVSDDARKLWEPRLEAVVAALEELAPARAAREGPGSFPVRPSSVDRLLAAADALSVERIAPPPQQPFDTAFGVAGRAWLRGGSGGDGAAPLARWCGCAECGTVEAVVPESGDPVWVVARRAGSSPAGGDERRITLALDWTANPLLAPLGIGPALPWSRAPGCARQRERAHALVDAGVAAGHGEAMSWMWQILSWPATWTALHGIAEVKTPVLRFVRDTQPVPGRLMVTWLGSSVPEKGARGNIFPFSDRAAAAAAPATRSEGSQHA